MEARPKEQLKGYYLEEITKHMYEIHSLRMECLKSKNVIK